MSMPLFLGSSYLIIVSFVVRYVGIGLEYLWGRFPQHVLQDSLYTASAHYYLPRGTLGLSGETM